MNRTSYDPEMTFIDFLDLSITKNRNFKLPWLKYEIDSGIKDLITKINNGCKKNKAQRASKGLDYNFQSVPE